MCARCKSVAPPYNKRNGYEFKGKRYDCGTKLGFIEANISYALSDPDYADELKEFIKNLL